MKNSPETLRKRNELKRKWKREIDPTSFPYYIIKKCKDCGLDKNCQWQHSFTQTGKPEYRSRCVSCHKRYLSELRKRRRRILTSQKRERSRKNKRKCVEYLGGCCIKCGYNKSDYSLTFHHRYPSKKENTIAVMLQNMSFDNEKLRLELDKCDLICFNCHMELHGEDYVQI